MIQVRDLSSHESWRFALGSPNFVIQAYAQVPEKGTTLTAPVISIQSPLSPTALTLEQALEFSQSMGRAVQFGVLMVAAARSDPSFYVYGRRFRVRGMEGDCQFSRTLEDGETEMFVSGRPDQRFRVNPMNLIPIIEVTCI